MEIGGWSCVTPPDNFIEFFRPITNEGSPRFDNKLSIIIGSEHIVGIKREGRGGFGSLSIDSLNDCSRKNCEVVCFKARIYRQGLMGIGIKDHSKSAILGVCTPRGPIYNISRTAFKNNTADLWIDPIGDT